MLLVKFMLKIQNFEKVFPNNYKMNFVPAMILNQNQYMVKCVPQNMFFQMQDLYKGYTNSLQIKLPYTIDKTTLLNIFLFYGKIEYIDINSKTNIIIIEYYKIISAIRCYAEFKFNLNKLSGNSKTKDTTSNVEISFINKNFEDKFYLGFKIKEKEIFKTKINTDCLIKILCKVGKILKIHQKMSYDYNGFQQQMYLNTIFVFNDSRDKEKADFILRRIISPYSGHNQNNNITRRFEETKECKEDNNIFNNNNSNNGNTLNNNINSSISYDILYESKQNLSSFYLIYQYVKKDDEIELKDDYDFNMNKKNDNNFHNNLIKPNTNYNSNSKANSNKENINTINIATNKHGKSHFQNKEQSKKTIENSIKCTFSSDINKSKYTGIKQRNTPVEERAKYIINLEKIINEKDQRTTLMIKNIPRNIMQSYLMEVINKKFENLFNFFYLPIDFIKKENAGYAFINFKNSKNIVDFYIEFNEKPWPFCQNRKCFISYARIQGFRAITQHFSSSNIMLVNNGDVKPYISDE